MKLLIRVNDDKKLKYSSPSTHSYSFSSYSYPSITKQHVHSKALLSSETTRSSNHHSKRLTSTSTKYTPTLFQLNRKLADSAVPSSMPISQPFLNINMKEAELTTTPIITTTTSLKTVDDIFILEPIDNANDYSEFLNQLISSSSNSFNRANKTNSETNSIINEKQLSSSSLSSSLLLGKHTNLNSLIFFLYFYNYFMFEMRL